MRRYLLVLILLPAATGICCNIASPDPTPVPSPTAVIVEPVETPIPAIDAASTALAQLNITLTAVAPTITPTPPPPETGVICVLPFQDSNENAQQDGDEEPLAGVRVVIEHQQVELEAYLRTAETKPFCFSGLPSGEYQVIAHGPPPYQSTTPSPAMVALSAGERFSLSWGFAEAPIPDGRVMLDVDDAGTDLFMSDPAGNTFFLATEQALFRTDDGGQSWTRMEEPPPARNVVPSPADRDLLFAGDGLDCFRGGDDAPLFISRNGGQSWTEAASGLNLRPAAAHPSDPEVAWAIGCAGAYRTDDGGSTWLHQPAKEWGLYTLDEIMPVGEQPDILLAAGNSEGGSGGLFRSEDAGRSWETVTDEPSLWISALLVNPGNADQIWFATPAGVWHSSDSGLDWRVSAAGLNAVTVGNGYQFDGRGLHALARAESGMLFLGTEQGLYQSGDGGSNWSPALETPWGLAPVLDLAVTDIRGETRLWVTTESGVYLYSP